MVLIRAGTLRNGFLVREAAGGVEDAEDEPGGGAEEGDPTDELRGIGARLGFPAATDQRGKERAFDSLGPTSKDDPQPKESVKDIGNDPTERRHGRLPEQQPRMRTGRRF